MNATNKIDACPDCGSYHDRARWSRAKVREATAIIRRAFDGRAVTPWEDCFGCLWYSEGKPTEEGWNRLTVTVRPTDDGRAMLVSHESDGADCDGRLSRSMENVYTRRTRAKRYSLHNVGDGRPRSWPWHVRDVCESQRDYSAERAGY